MSISRETIRSSALEKQLDEARKRCETLENSVKTLTDTIISERRSRRVIVPTAKRQPKLKGDIIRMGCGDVHGAKMDKAAVAAFIGDVKAIQPDEIILGGDIVDCGGFLAEHHVIGYVAEMDYSYAQDCEAANGFLDALQAAAPNAKIEYIEGNHERRVETWCCTVALRRAKDAQLLHDLIGPEKILRLRERGISYFRQSECYDGLTVPGVIKRGKCFFLHGLTASRNAAQETVRKTGGNVVFFHTHRSDSVIVRPTGTGPIGGWNPGCMCLHQPLWQHTRPTDWTTGEFAQIVTRTNRFLHLNIPILDGTSNLTKLLKT